MRALAGLLFAFLLAACRAAPSVEVDGERLTGTYVGDGKVAAFLGVPFAEPPVGELRWRAPEPLATSVAEREVTAFAPACMQSMRILDWYRSMAVQFGGEADYYEDLEVSEDCLYLNIWTPVMDSAAALPVMVWAHGGSNKSGWSYEPNYRGQELAPKGVVVVSVAYRQGVFGFFSHPELPDDEPRANFAYWDLIAALQWIRDHIRDFGGDPDRITLFGESAGAQNIVALMVVDEASGLFHRAIAQSNAGFGLPSMSTLADEEQRALGLAAAFGLDERGSLAALRSVPAAELLSVYEQTFPDYYHSAALDGQLLTKSVWESLQNHEFERRELIIGTNRHEWYASVAEDAGRDDVRQLAAELFENSDPDAALAIVEDATDPRRAMDRLRTAVQMLCPSQLLAATMNEAGAPAWVYYFTRIREDEAAKKLGAYHGAEYPYVFGTHDDYMSTTETDLDLQQKMQTYWLNFARTGNPNGEDVPDWPRFAGPQPAAQQLGDTVKTIPAPEAGLCALFEQGLARRDSD